jgi:3-hydroxybutyryl-CoA dehydrogenase
MNSKSVKQVAVLGLGTMGHGIAQAFASAGYEVRGFDAMAVTRKGARERVRQNLKDFVAAGLIRSKEVPSILARIKIVDSEQEAVADAQFITEAVAEDVEVKRELFARLETMTTPKAILASNSSTFPISQSATKMKRPERAIVTHWFNPPHIVPVVEVVPGPKTNEATTRTTLALLRSVGKKAIRINEEIPGFLVNRMQIALWREVWDLLDRGIASPEDIDAAICGTLGFRLAAVGQLEVNDFGGLDIHSSVYRNLAPLIRSDTKLPAAVQKLVDAGHYGVKTGKGFYKYTAQSINAKRSRRDKRFLTLLKLFYDERKV